MTIMARALATLVSILILCPALPAVAHRGIQDFESSPYVVMRNAEDFLDGNDRNRTRAHVRLLGQRLRTITLPDALRDDGVERPSRIYQLLGQLSALEGDFSRSLEDFRSAEAAFRNEGDETSALDMQRGQATALALAGRYDEALALDQAVAFCAPGETCSPSGVMSVCREVTGRIQGGRAIWNSGFEALGPRSQCTAEASLEIARLALLQGRNELVEPFLALSIFASWGSRYGSPEVSARIRRAASNELLARLSNSEADEGRELLARLEAAGRGEPVPAAGDQEAPASAPTEAAQLRRGGLDIVHEAIRANVRAFGQISRTYGYMDSGVSRPFTGADQLFDVTRTLAEQNVQVDDLAAAEQWSDLALRYASRAIAPYYPLRSDFGAASPQCPPRRSDVPECRSWEVEAIESYSSLQIASVLAERAQLEGRRGDVGEFLTLTGLSERVMSNWLAQNWTSARDVADQFAAQVQQDEETMRQLGQARRVNPAVTDQAARLAFGVAQRFQFGEIDAAVRDARVRGQIQDPAIARLWQERQDLVNDRASMERGSGEFARASAAIAAVEARLPFSSRDLERQTAFHTVSAESVQRNLSPDEVALVIVPLKFRTEVFVLTSATLDWRTSARSGEWVESRVDRLREHLNASHGAEGGFPRAIAFELYQELLAPFERLIDRKRLLLSASGALNRLPLTVLVTEPPIGADLDPVALRRTAWLGVRNSVVVVPSLTLLEHRARSRPTQRTGLVAFADPALPDAELAEVEERGAGNLGRLVGAVREVEAIRRASTGRIEVFVGARATEAALRQVDLTNLGVLAFATHGLAADEWRPGSEPGLLFTPNLGNGDDLDDGYLSASEAAVLPIGADIVLLSACDTASSRTSGGESLTGLALSFLFAGGRTVMATHWPVADEAASTIVAGAVNQAQERTATGLADAVKNELRSLVLEGSRESYADPRFWAPFVVIGS